MGFKTFIWIIVSLSLIILDQRTSYLSSLKSLYSTVVLPIQYIADFPYRVIDAVKTNFESRQSLMQENNELRAKDLLLETKIQQLDALFNENKQLRIMLNAANSISYTNEKILLSRILKINNNVFDQQFILNQGSASGVYIGQTVVDEVGLIGQIIATDSATSRVLLITSTHSGVPVQDIRNGVRAIAVGNGYTGDLSLLYTPNTADIRVGDVMLTSGLGVSYPMGYKVGVVKSITRKSTERFASIKITPYAKLNTGKFVLLVWPKEKNKKNT